MLIKAGDRTINLDKYDYIRAISDFSLATGEESSGIVDAAYGSGHSEYRGHIQIAKFDNLADAKELVKAITIAWAALKPIFDVDLWCNNHGIEPSNENR